MPTYVYGCDVCGHRFEKSQKFADEPIKVCPECGSAVRRIFQPAGIVFKGSGWHINDYKRSGNGGKSDGEKSDGNKTESAKSEGSKADGAKSDSGKSESKPAESKSDGPASPAGDSNKPAQAAS